MNKLKKILVISVSLVGVIVFVSYSSLVKASSYNTGVWGSSILKADITLQQPIMITDINGTEDLFGRGTYVSSTVAYGWNSSTTTPIFAGSTSPAPQITLIGSIKVIGNPLANLSVTMPDTNIYLRDALGATQTVTPDANNYFELTVTGANNLGACYSAKGTSALSFYLVKTASVSCTPANSYSNASTAMAVGTGYIDIYFRIQPKSITTLRGNLTVNTNITVSYP